VRKAGEEPGHDQRLEGGGQRGGRVAQRERRHQGDQQPGARDPGRQHGHDRRPDDHAQRVGRDEMSAVGDRGPEAGGDLGKQAHRDELGGADAETTERDGAQADRHPAGAWPIDEGCSGGHSGLRAKVGAGGGHHGVTQGRTARPPPTIP
jgi:hypothetical protein